MYNYLLTSSLGLEALVKKEIEKQGYEIMQVQDKAVYFQGGLEAMARMNLWSRFGNTLYLILNQAENIMDFDSYFDTVSAIDWKKYIPKDYEIIVKATSIKSELGATSSLQALAKKAIVKKLLSPHLNPPKKPLSNSLLKERGQAAVSSSPGGEELRGGIGRETLYENPDIGTINIRILLQDNTLKILLNTSGEGLHKRGYREMTGDAPIKENIAAALVILSGWRFREPLYDIFTGSGTIPIEAAMIARNIAPGMQRSFAFEDWSWLPENLLEQAKIEARAKQFSGEYQIYGTDIRKDILEIAKRNAQYAGVGDTISFHRQDYRDVFSGQSPLAPLNKGGSFTQGSGGISGTLVSNPPYGNRLDETDVDMIHRDLAELLEKNTDLLGGIITNYPEWNNLSKTPYKNRKLYNGGEQVYFYKKEPR